MLKSFGKLGTEELNSFSIGKESIYWFGNLIFKLKIFVSFKTFHISFFRNLTGTIYVSVFMHESKMQSNRVE